MKRARSTRRFLLLESLEGRQLLTAGISSLTEATVRLPKPAIVPSVVAKPMQTVGSPDVSLAPSSLLKGGANPVESTSPVPTKIADPNKALEAQEPQSSLTTNTIGEQLSPSQIEDIEGLNDLALAEELMNGGEEGRLSPINVDALFAQAGRRDVNQRAPGAGSTDEVDPLLGERGDATTRYGSAQSLFGDGVNGEVSTAGTALTPVGYREGDGVYDATTGTTAKEYEGTVLEKLANWLSGTTDSTNAGQALGQAIEEQDKNGEGDSNDAAGDSATEDSGSTDSSASSGDGKSAERVDMGDFEYYVSDDGTTWVLEFDDGTVVVHDTETNTTITLKPDGTVIEEDANGNKTEYKPSTPAGDEPPVPDWIREMIAEALAELRAGYQPGSGDIDWGDFDTGTGYLNSLDAQIPDLLKLLFGADSHSPDDLNQGEFQQPDEGNIDPAPNDGN
jgi:hypothetical protein